MALTLDKVPNEVMTYQQLTNNLNQQGLYQEFAALQTAADTDANFTAFGNLGTQFAQKKITARQYVSGLMQLTGGNGTKESWLMWGVVAGLVLWFASKRRKR